MYVRMYLYVRMYVCVSPENKTNFERYAISFYWAAITSTQVGYGDIIAYTNIEVSTLSFSITE